MWDILLAERLAVLGKEAPGLATDELPQSNYQATMNSKKMSRPGRGWVMVRAPKLAVDDLIAALEAGDFYASSGVTLKDVRRSKDELSSKSKPNLATYTTEFIGIAGKDFGSHEHARARRWPAWSSASRAATARRSARCSPR